LEGKIIIKKEVKIMQTSNNSLILGIDHGYGGTTLAAHSIVSHISSCCMIMSDWSKALAYISCGISIAFKNVSKNNIYKKGFFAIKNLFVCFYLIQFLLTEYFSKE
jgi:hypothetical protein